MAVRDSDTGWAVTSARPPAHDRYAIGAAQPEPGSLTLLGVPLAGVSRVRLRVAIGLAAIVGGLWLTIAFIGIALSEPSTASSQRVATELVIRTWQRRSSMLAVGSGAALVRPPLTRDRQLVCGTTAMIGVVALPPVTVCVWFIAEAVTSATRSLVG